MLVRPLAVPVAVLAFALGGGLGCRGEREHAAGVTAASATPEVLVLLAGNFTSVAKRARGRAEVVRRGDQYELRLSQVQLDVKGPARVYLVGAELPATTRSVLDAEPKYDLAELERGVAEQVVALPSAPAPTLRSVVLWEPRYQVNLAYAPLQPASARAP